MDNNVKNHITYYLFVHIYKCWIVHSFKMSSQIIFHRATETTFYTGHILNWKWKSNTWHHGEKFLSSMAKYFEVEDFSWDSRGQFLSSIA